MSGNIKNTKLKNKLPNPGITPSSVELSFTFRSPLNVLVPYQALQFRLRSGGRNEVMYAVGYTDMKAFRTIFKKVTGITPVEYKMKFSKN